MTGRILQQQADIRRRFRQNLAKGLADALQARLFAGAKMCAGVQDQVGNAELAAAQHLITQGELRFFPDAAFG